MTPAAVNIALVEDNAGDSRLIQTYLFEIGNSLFDLRIARTLAEGIKLIESWPCQAILLDLNLPDSNGLDTLRDLKKHFPDLPVVVLTGKIDEKLALEALSAGAQDYLFKDHIDGFSIKRALQYAIERQRIEAEKHRLETMLFQAQKMEAVGTLAGGIAHDFNNILGAILGYAELAQEMALEGRNVGQELKNIVYSVERARNLVRQILTFGRKVQPCQEQVDLNQEIQRASRILKRTLPKMVSLELDLSCKDCNILADPTQIEQVVLNLGVNAADAMPDGGVIHIKTRPVPSGQAGDQRGPMVEITVSDNGVGMSEEVLSHIYDPFFTTKENGKGTGLGLATVYGIVKGHQGDISCQSQPGKGTTFVIRFPASAEECVAESSPAATEKPATSPGHETVMVVDDEVSLCDLASRILKRTGYEVLCAYSGEEALDLLRRNQQRVDLVVLDLGMPGMGGMACLAELKKLSPEIKVVIASGYLQPMDGRDLREQGASGIVAKPYRMNDMLLTIRSVLDGQTPV